MRGCVAEKALVLLVFALVFGVCQMIIGWGYWASLLVASFAALCVPRSETVEGLTEERAYTLLADRRDKAPAPKKTPARKTTARKAPARKTTARKSSGK